MTRKTFLIFFLFFSLTLVYSQKSIGSIDRLDSEINNLISKHVSLFTGNGGDISNIIEKALIINMRNNFGRENLYNISISEFKEALDTFVSTKKTVDVPPYGMYN